MRTKNRDVREEYLALWRTNPRLLAVLLYIDSYAKSRYGKSVCVTSIVRQDGTIHSVERAADCRIEFNRDGYKDLEWDEWEAIASHVHTEVFDYGLKSNGKPTTCIHLLDKGTPNQHAHIQVNVLRWQGSRNESV